MGDEINMKQLNLVNALTNTKTYIPLSIKSDIDGNLILRNLKDTSIVKISNNSSEIHYSNGKRNNTGEYDFAKTADVNFDENNKPTQETMSRIFSAMKAEIKVAEERPTVKASELAIPKKAEIKEITPQIKEQKNVSVAMSPLDRLKPEHQKHKQIDKVA
jgi:hypothetical protein